MKVKLGIAFCVLFWVVLLVLCCGKANAGQALTMDCTLAIDEVTSAKIQFNSSSPVDAPLVSTCGSGATKVTCIDPASKTICYPDSLWPTTAFVAKAMVSNIRADSVYSLPLSVPGVPSSPSLLRAIQQ